MRVSKREIKSGAVLEIDYFPVSNNVKTLTNAKPKERFANAEERNAHNVGIQRRANSRLVNANFTPKSFKVELTLDDSHNVQTLDEAKKIIKNYVRNIRRKYPDSKVMAYIGHHGQKARYHFHLLIDGIPPDVFLSKWFFGMIKKSENLWSHTQDYTAVAEYFFNQGVCSGKGASRCHKSGNFIKPEYIRTREVKQAPRINKPPHREGYVHVYTYSNGLGYIYFKYVRTSGHRKKAKKPNKKSRN